MYQLVKKLRELEPYEPISGEYKIRLDANESFIKLDNSELSEVINSVPINRYPDPYATETIKAFAKLYDVNPDCVTAGNGSDELISIITGCFLEKGSKVICFSPDFSMYSFYSQIYELDVEVLTKDENFQVDFDFVIDYANENNVQCILFSNPCNPTSEGITADKIAKLLNKVNALVIVDEAYMEFWNDNESFINETDNFDNLIVLKTCSKAIGMAAVRLGFAVTSLANTKALRAAKSPYNVNSITQAIGTYVLSDKERIENNVELIKNSIRSLYWELINGDFDFFEQIYKPKTNFVLIRTDSAKEIYEYLLSKSIAIRFMGKYLRITCGTDNENMALLAALKEYK